MKVERNVKELICCILATKRLSLAIADPVAGNYNDFFTAEVQFKVVTGTLAHDAIAVKVIIF